MRSELIHEIFSVETEAEKIVANAKEACRNNIAEAHEKGERTLRQEIDTERQERFKAVEEARRASQARIETYRAAAEASFNDDQRHAEAVQRAAEQLLAILCSSKCYEEPAR